MCLERFILLFDHQGVLGLVEILRFWCDCCFASVCVSLSEEWRARTWSGLVCVLVSIDFVSLVMADSPDLRFLEIRAN